MNFYFINHLYINYVLPDKKTGIIFNIYILITVYINLLLHISK